MMCISTIICIFYFTRLQNILFTIHRYSLIENYEAKFQNEMVLKLTDSLQY